MAGNAGKAQLYTRYPLWSVALYNGSTVLHYALGGVGAVAGAFVVGLLGSGLLDALASAGTPNPGAAIGAMIGAFGGGYLTMKCVSRDSGS